MSLPPGWASWLIWSAASASMTTWSTLWEQLSELIITYLSGSFLNVCFSHVNLMRTGAMPVLLIWYMQHPAQLAIAEAKKKNCWLSEWMNEWISMLRSRPPLLGPYLNPVRSFAINFDVALLFKLHLPLQVWCMIWRLSSPDLSSLLAPLATSLTDH